jgi:triacylglycerol lipase
MYKRAAAFVSDNSHATRRYFSKTWAKAGLPNYIYYFNVRPNGVSEYLGAQHFEEVAFVFYNLNGDGYKPITGASPFENTPQSYKDVANMMSRMWVSFFVDQNPSYAGAVQWPPSQVDDTHIIYFDANVTSLAYVRPDTYRAEGINYMHELYHQ